MSSKYPALLLWPAAAACALGEHRRLRWTRREWAGLLLLPLLALAPWLIKNQIFYGNPLFPFFHERIRPEALHMPSWSYLSQGGLELSALLSREGFMSFLRQPWDFSRHASDFGGSLGPAWLALCPLLFMARGSEVRRLGVWALFTWLPLAAVSSITRYFIPVLASSAALWGAGLAAAEAKGWRWAGRCAAAAMGAVALAYATMILPRMATLRAAVGSVSRWDYLKATSFASHTPTPPHAGFEFLEAHAPRTAKVLIFGDARAFPLSRDFTAASADQRSVLEVWADQAGSEEALAEKFYSEGITHVLVNHAEIFRNRTALRFSRRGKAALDGFWARRTLKVFQDAVPGDRWVAVYRILDEAEAASPHDADDLFAAYRVR